MFEPNAIELSQPKVAFAPPTGSLWQSWLSTVVRGRDAATGQAGVVVERAGACGVDHRGSNQRSVLQFLKQEGLDVELAFLGDPFLKAFSPRFDSRARASSRSTIQRTSANHFRGLLNCGAVA